MNEALFLKNISQSEVLRLTDLVEYEEKKVIKSTLVERSDLGMVMLSVYKDECIGGHSSTGDALVNILEGVAEITIDNKVYIVKAGESIVLPANINHGLKAVENFKMMLVVVKPLKKEN